MHILLSKADKLSRQEQQKVLASVKKELHDYPQISIQLFSSSKKTGTAEVEQQVQDWFAAVAEDDFGGEENHGAAGTLPE
ncbi:putative GTP-binding protein EngB [compost metagenome]